jgi:hypothetical protein
MSLAVPQLLQVPETHAAPLMQSASDVQLVLHAVAEAHLSSPGQGALDVEQVPFWHVAVARMFPEQLVVPQEVPFATSLQVPLFPVRLHFWQVLVHAELQHTPSTQKPLAQTPFLPEQALPLARLFTHFVSMQ